MELRINLSTMPGSEPVRDTANMGHKGQRQWQAGYLAGARDEQGHGDRSNAEPERAPRWQLDDVSLAALLTALGPDVEQASHKYSKLRERLCRYFEWNRVDNADELADETLDRLARRLGRVASRDSTLDPESPDSIRGREDAVERPEDFAAGIARLVLHEQRRRDVRAGQLLERVQRDNEASRAAQRAEESRRTEELSALLDECMADLAQDQQDLIRRYYSVEGRTMIDARKRLAEELGISMNALRNRALRIRAELESRVRTRVGSRN